MATKKRGGDVCIFSFGGQSAFSSKFGNYAQRKSQGVRQTIHRLHNPARDQGLTAETCCAEESKINYQTEGF